MYCINCGRIIRDNSKFCSYCGQKIETPIVNKGYLKITRGTSVGDIAVKYKVILDGREIDSLKGNEEKIYKISLGKHSVQFVISYGIKAFTLSSRIVEIDLTEYAPRVHLVCYTAGRGFGYISTAKMIADRDNYITVKIVE